MLNLIIYCPVMEATIKLGSKLLEEVGQFTRFMLWVLGKGYTPQDINQKIELDEYVISEELNYLCNIGFISEGEDESYTFRESGRIYLELMETIEWMNAEEMPVHINCFTGQVQSYHQMKYAAEELSGKEIKLPVRISTHFFSNRNYENSREYLFESYQKVFDGLREEQKDSIYTLLESKKEIKYVAYECKEVPKVAQEFCPEELGDSPLVLKRRVKKTFYRLYDQRLEPYRTVLQTLELLRKFEAGLLSEKSAELLRLEHRERLLNEEERVLYLDTCRQEIVRAFANYEEPKQKTIISLPDRTFSVREDALQKEWNITDGDIGVAKLEAEDIEVFQIVPFHIFTERNGEEDGEESSV